MAATEPYALHAFRALLDLHDGCMDAGLAEAGFHALTAAMHCAEATASHEQLRLVLQRAELRQRQIDAIQPPHRLSSTQAGWRAHTPVFASLAITANAIMVRLKADAVRAQSIERMR
ncbi:MAG TPA: hypothetical protein VJQ46_16245 [Gemmatimonadales bacterium]|nr:hypothetical protein [Gemmatimonadales bacterium]